jgi:hypothetical protein
MGSAASIGRRKESEGYATHGELLVETLGVRS